MPYLSEKKDGSVVKIEFSSDDGDSWEVIDANASVDESPYAWIVPNLSSQYCFIKLSVPGAPELFKTNPAHFSIHEAVGLDEVSANELSFTLYPNPSMDIVQIKCNENDINDLTIQLIDLSGKELLIYSGQLQEINTKLADDSRPLGKGAYFIKIYVNGKVFTKKFIKL